MVGRPRWELCCAAGQGYRDSVLPPGVTRRVAVEAGMEQGWHKYIGRGGGFVGMRGFGASAPYAQLMEHFGLTAESVVMHAKALLGK